jgi:hypothetical protein
LDGTLNQDLTTPQQVVVKDLSNGIYFVQIGVENKTVVYRKIAIMNKN